MSRHFTKKEANKLHKGKCRRITSAQVKLITLMMALCHLGVSINQIGGMPCFCFQMSNQLLSLLLRGNCFFIFRYLYCCDTLHVVYLCVCVCIYNIHVPVLLKAAVQDVMEQWPHHGFRKI